MLDLIDLHSHWVFLGGLLLAMLLLDRVVHGLLSWLGRRLQPVHQVWLHAFVGALAAPLRAVLWVLGLTIALRRLFPRGEVELLDEGLRPAISIVLSVLVAWGLFRFIDAAGRNLRARARANAETVDPTASDAIGKLLRAVIVVATALSIMQSLQVSLAGLLAFGGAAGIAVGFAAQTLVANLFGGLTIFASRVFKIGEAIIIPGTELMGDVEHIGWRSTRVLGWDCKPFYVPNSLFNSSTVINHSRMTHRRASETIYLRYEDLDRVPAVVREANALLEASEDVDYFVFRFDCFGERALQLYLYAYVRATAYADFMRIKEELLLAIAGIVRRQGCELVLPLAHVQVAGADPLRTAESPTRADTRV